MSLFKPFGRNRKLFQRNATSHSPAATSEEETPPPPQSSVPVENRAHTLPLPGPARVAAPTPNFAMEAEKTRQASIQSEWTQAVDTLAVANRMMKAATEAHRDTLNGQAPLIADIVRSIVERTLHGVFRIDNEALVRVIQTAAEALPSDVVRLRLNPADIERVHHLLPEGMAAAVIPDATVTGGCIAETQRASVDATLSAALNAVDAMLEEWQSSEAQ